MSTTTTTADAEKEDSGRKGSRVLELESAGERTGEGTGFETSGIAMAGTSTETQQDIVDRSEEEDMDDSEDDDEGETPTKKRKTSPFDDTSIESPVFPSDSMEDILLDRLQSDSSDVVFEALEILNDGNYDVEEFIGLGGPAFLFLAMKKWKDDERIQQVSFGTMEDVLARDSQMAAASWLGMGTLDLVLRILILHRNKWDSLPETFSQILLLDRGYKVAAQLIVRGGEETSDIISNAVAMFLHKHNGMLLLLETLTVCARGNDLCKRWELKKEVTAFLKCFVSKGLVCKKEMEMKAFELIRSENESKSAQEVGKLTDELLEDVLS